VASNVKRSGSRIEHNGLILANQRRCRSANFFLFLAIFPEPIGKITFKRNRPDEHRSSGNPENLTSFRQSMQIPADGHFRYVEAASELGNGSLALVGQEPKDFFFPETIG
jgi:hypothetical protein